MLPAAAAAPSASIGIYTVDRMLEGHSEHFDYRQKQFEAVRDRISQAEGSVADFAQGYKHFGFHRGDGGTTFKEWAPGAQAAQLIGDFNGWTGTWLERDAFGAWSCHLPDGPDGTHAIPHASRVKIRLQHPGGWWVDRIPAWITRATVEPNRMGANYDGVYWEPPEPYQWQHQRPSRPGTLRIYEAHVGMSSEEPAVASYTYFKDHVLPRIAKQGYNAVQLMAVQEHSYYASFGYHVTNPFAASSRSGTPEELKALIDKAHGLGLAVLLDIVHSHISNNVDDGLAGFDLGQPAESNYFLQGEAGYHKLWDSRLFNYSHWEVLRYLLSNLRFWLEEYRFDGFRCDGVTSMLYWDHGIHRAFSGSYDEYFSPGTNVDACVYLMLANQLVHDLVPDATTVAEDVSGMPTLCRPVAEGGIGFDYRLSMGPPDGWVKLVKETRDEDWAMQDLVNMLCGRRYDEKAVAYVESHDQSLVGDQTLAWRLMGKDMYKGMSALSEETAIIARGMALHKVIRLITMAIGGDGWLNFQGNEWGHPEWIDFPREGNAWSHHYCRRQWSLADSDHLRYKYLLAWDAAMQQLEEQFCFQQSSHQLVSFIGTGSEQVIVAERGALVFVFNFSPFHSFEGYKVGTPEAGKYRAVLSSDDSRFGGQQRVNPTVDHFTAAEGQPGVPESNFNNRAFSIQVLSPSRSAVVYALQPEVADAAADDD
eukprot:jgi/Astpho2/493/fgenesh1_pm.00011_%23_33_t